jgi:hypothetical protein
MKRVFTLLLVSLLLSSFAIECRAQTTTAGPDVAPASNSPKQARMALLIGNLVYDAAQAKVGETKFNNLSNPCNDVIAVEAKLVMMGWDSADIVRKCNADTSSIITELRIFVQKFQYAEKPLGIIYFAGHGLQVNDKNYLFGTDAAPNLSDAANLLARNSRATLFLKDSVDVNSFVYNSVGRITDGALLVILDACRENPLLDIIVQRNLPIRASAPKPIASPPGILTEFSTSDGAIAADGIGGNSPFAAALLRQLRENTRVDDILAEVGTRVTDDTHERQIPQRTGYFAQQTGFFWCFYGCLAAVDQATRFGSINYESMQVASLSIEGVPLRTRRLGFPRLTQAADAPGAASALPNTPTDNVQKDSAQKSSTQLIFARPVASLPNSEVVTPLNVDVFYCLGDGVAERRAISQNLANAVASIAFRDPVESLTAISQVRLRGINPDPSSIPVPALNSNIVLFDSTDPGSRAFSSAVVAASSTPLTKVSEREATPGYMSIFVCSNADVRRPPGQIFFQIASRDQEGIARRSIASLKEALPDLSISDSLALQPEKSPAETEVHYQLEQDGEAARVLAQVLSGTLNVPVMPKFVNPSLIISADPTPGSFEVWLGKNLSKSSHAIDPKSSFWTTRDAVGDAARIQSDIRQFKCGLPGLCN